MARPMNELRDLKLQKNDFILFFKMETVNLSSMGGYGAREKMKKIPFVSW
jgi:hypothetical protein